jgi:hypothetical protein
VYERIDPLPADDNRDGDDYGICLRSENDSNCGTFDGPRDYRGEDYVNGHHGPYVIQQNAENRFLLKVNQFGIDIWEEDFYDDGISVYLAIDNDISGWDVSQKLIRNNYGVWSLQDGGYKIYLTQRGDIRGFEGERGG